MKTMRLDEVKVQAGKSGALTVAPVCVCGAGPNEPSQEAPAVAAPICPACGGSVPQAAVPERQERRHLQDFLSAFV